MKPTVLMALIFGMQTVSVYGACDTGKRAEKPTSQYIVKGATVYDKESRLTWQRCSAGQTWQEGQGCVGTVKGLPRLQAELLEENGWRLPTIDELATLVSPTCSRPAINEDVFPGMDPDNLEYWSKTAPRDSLLDYVNFENGLVSSDADEEPYAVRRLRVQ